FRYLASGNSLASLHYEYRLGKSTIAKIVRQVCTALWRVLQPIYMPPISEDRWREISDVFFKYANFPNCIGAVDGKHIRIVQPSNSGSLYHNYKHFFSIILLAVCDANYCFLYVDVGAYGKSNDSSIFKESLFYKRVSEGTFNIPAPKPINLDNTSLPYVFVGDDAFGLSKNVMCPYVGNQLSHEKKNFNYRLSRARRYIECTFGIMANKWQIFHRPLNVNIDVSESIVLACCVLQNFLRSRDGLRTEDTYYQTPFQNIGTGQVLTPSNYARNVRDKFAQHFVEDGRLPWQDRMVK
uniref:Protein ALP1-like n=1 Tax=Diabrotica virgifera virgifera TaxID=50390 RepID=A0A6P7GPA1_DIAVI